MNPRIKYFSASIASSIIWGFFSIPLRNIRSFPPTEILICRVFTSFLICALITVLFRKRIFREDLNYLRSLPGKEKSMLWKLIIASGIFITANWFSFIYAINHVSIQSGAFAYMVCPIITALFGFFILGERITRIQWISILICIVSISFLAFNAVKDVTFSVIIALLYAAYLIVQKKITGVNKFNVLLVQLLISCLLIIPYYLQDMYPLPTDSGFWINIVVISVMFTIIPLFLSLYALTGMPSSTLGIMIYVNPIVAFFVAFFYFDEHASISRLVAYLILLFAVILFNRDIIRSIINARSVKG